MLRPSFSSPPRNLFRRLVNSRLLEEPPAMTLWQSNDQGSQFCSVPSGSLLATSMLFLLTSSPGSTKTLTSGSLQPGRRSPLSAGTTEQESAEVR